MSLYAAYLEEIEKRKEQGLNPKPIDDAALTEEIIAQIKDTGHAHREQSLKFFIYNTLPGTTSAAGVKAEFLKKSCWARRRLQKSQSSLRLNCYPT